MEVYIKSMKKQSLLENIPFKFIKNNGFMEESIYFALTLEKYKILFLQNEILLIFKEIEEETLRSEAITTHKTPNKNNLINWLINKTKKITKTKNIIKEDINNSKEEKSKIKMLKISFNNYNKNVKINGLEKSNSNISYIKGIDESKWIECISSYNKIKYEEIYQGIDLVFYENNKQLEFDFIVKSEGNINNIEINIEGSSNIELDNSGALNILLNQSKLTIHRPNSFQYINENLIPINSSLKISNNKITFEVENYDKTVELIIDPILEFSTYLGSTNEDRLTSIVVDKYENIYIGGYTWTIGYDNQPLNPNFNSNFDIYITKINKYGNIEFTTYLGGSGSDYCNDIIVDEEGSIYLTGKTNSTDFPMRNSIPTYSTNQGEDDIFISKIRINYNDNLGVETSQLTFSTYFGGSNNDCANALALKNINNLYITGTTQSPDFENYSTIYNFQNGTDIFLTQININENPGDTSTIEYSTLLGGTDGGANTIAVDELNNVYIGGYAKTRDFPCTDGSDTSFLGVEAAYTLKFSETKDILYANYRGTNGINEATSIEVDINENIYLLVNSKLNLESNNVSTIYIIDKNGNETKKKTITGNQDIFGSSIALDSNGYIYIGGYTNSSDLYLLNSLFNYSGGMDGFLIKMNSNGDIKFSSYLGGSEDDYARGIAIDNNSNMYIAGDTLSQNFPMKNEIQNYNGDYDVFVSKISQGRYLYLGNIDTMMTIRKEYISYEKCSEVICSGNVSALELLMFNKEIEKSVTYIDWICVGELTPVSYEYKNVELSVFANYCLSLFTTEEHLDNLKIYATNEKSIVGKSGFGCFTLNEVNPSKEDFELIIEPIWSVIPEDTFEDYYGFRISGTIGLEYRGDLNE